MLQVHPKTVYYWVRTGRLHAETTPGGLLRVKAEDARALCQRSGMPVPTELSTVRRRVHVIERERGVSRALGRSLKARGFEVRAFDEIFRGLIATVKEPPEAVLIEAGDDRGPIRRLCEALEAEPLTQRTRRIGIGVGEAEQLGVEAMVEVNDLSTLGRLLR